ncbi:MAG: class I SAM-dependent methyltransferase [Polyangiaceae bacterium]|nr:class I SAM-dependent methyltransferase [Polyangiaceae bacterium]
MKDRSFDPANEAEFDAVADGYEAMHQKSIAASGEDPAYFARYKRDVLVRLFGAAQGQPVLDFGCGIGNLTSLLSPAFREVHGYDPSSRSVAHARERAPGARFYERVDDIPKSTFGIAVLANVLHHVPPADRRELVAEVAARLLPGGHLVVFEHNPLNPLTRKAVADCAFDKDAVLLRSSETRGLLRGAGLEGVRREYIVFFPKALAALRGLEPRLAALPLGAQYVALGRKSG